MKSVIQRVKSAEVAAYGKKIAKIGKGFLVFLGIEKNDTEKEVLVMAKKLPNLGSWKTKKEK